MWNSEEKEESELNQNIFSKGKKKSSPVSYVYFKISQMLKFSKTLASSLKMWPMNPCILLM